MFYADFDDQTDCWCVFHTETSMAYGCYATEEQAEAYANYLNGTVVEPW